MRVIVLLRARTLHAMIRGNIRHRPVRSAEAASDLHTAAAVGAAQIPALLVIWFFIATDDQYGGGGSALGLACAMVLTPLWLPPVGMVHALVQSLPATLLTHRVRRRARGPEWVWQVLCALLVGVLWAVPPALLWGWPFGTTAVVLAALGVLPALTLAYARVRRRTGRAWGTWGTWWRSGVVGLGLLVSVPGCVLAGRRGRSFGCAPTAERTSSASPPSPTSTRAPTSGSATARAPGSWTPRAATTPTAATAPTPATVSSYGSTADAGRRRTGRSPVRSGGPSCSWCSATRTRGS
ncbi:hypothetical protein RKD23_004272 [Streptomyces sp. SAI-170]